MNIFKKCFCRLYQFTFRCLLPVLPYREPKILVNYQEIISVLIEQKIERLLLVTDKSLRNIGLTKTLEEQISSNGIFLNVYDGTVPNPTTQNVKEAVEIYKRNHCQGIIAFGGGSPMDCAKATGACIANQKKSLAQMGGVLKVGKKLPLLIAVPTTAGTGSETTLAAVITDSESRHKYSINDFPLIPRYAALIPELTVNLPQNITASTGIDALTHAVEAFIGQSTTPKTRDCAKKAVKDIFKFLPIAYENSQDIEARKSMLKASYNAGVAFTKSYVGYVHAIAHSLGGKYDVPHGLANAIILPHVLKKYGKKIYKKLWKLGVYANLFDKSTPKNVGAEIFIKKIEQLNESMKIGKYIDAIKVQDIAELAKTAEKEANPLYPVPVLWTQKDLEQIYYKIVKK